MLLCSACHRLVVVVVGVVVVVEGGHAAKYNEAAAVDVVEVIRSLLLRSRIITATCHRSIVVALHHAMLRCYLPRVGLLVSASHRGSALVPTLSRWSGARFTSTTEEAVAQQQQQQQQLHAEESTSADSPSVESTTTASPSVPLPEPFARKSTRRTPVDPKTHKNQPHFREAPMVRDPMGRHNPGQRRRRDSLYYMPAINSPDWLMVQQKLKELNMEDWLDLSIRIAPNAAGLQLPPRPGPRVKKTATTTTTTAADSTSSSSSS